MLFSLEDIKYLCGESFYKRGRTYYTAGDVTGLEETDGGDWKARVEGGRTYKVRIGFRKDGTIESRCSCPAYDMYGPCKHIAAVLIAVHEKQSSSVEVRHLSDSARAAVSSNSSKPEPETEEGAAARKRRNDESRMDKMLALFAESKASKKRSDPAKANGNGEDDAPGTRLQLQFVFKTKRIRKGYIFSVELKTGIKRLYVVQKIRQFLDCAEHGESLYFTSHFTFNPLEQEMNEAEAELLRILYELKESEILYKEAEGGYYYESADGRDLLVTPPLWQRILPLLGRVDAVMERFGKAPDTLETAAERLPFRACIGASSGGAYRLEISGLADLEFLPRYGCALEGGRVYSVEPAEIRLFEGLREQLNADGKPGDRIDIPHEHMQRFARDILPKLDGLGEVEIEDEVWGRIVKPSLRAELYLDYTDDCLNMKFRFNYGEIRFNPLEDHPAVPKDTILIRETESERRLLDLIDPAYLHREKEGWTTRTENGLYLALHRTAAEAERQGVDLYWSPSARLLVRERRETPAIAAELSSGLDWLEVSFEADEMDEADKALILQAIVLKKKFTRLRGGAFVSLEEERFGELRNLVGELGAGSGEIENGSLRMPAVRSLLLPPGSRSSKTAKWGRELRRFLGRLRDPESAEAVLPARLGPVLREYQTTGFQWMKTLSDFRFGGILADDMGLGKTLQSIAYICSELEERQRTDEARSSARLPVLIVCPASLSLNWAAEFAKFAPWVEVLVAAGPKGEREALLDRANEADVVVTSYPLLRRDAAKYAETTFHALILDEAQMIKNAASQTAKAVNSIKADRRFALTGTPVENSLEDLWSIFNAVSAQLFGSRRSFLDLPHERIAALSAPFIMRRLKKEVLRELPDRIDAVRRSELEPAQKKLYLAHLSALREETEQDLETEGFQKSRMKILAGITRLRQLCCHPGLFVENYRGSSGKLEQLLEVLEECRESGRRVLVFSQFASMLEMIREELRRSGRVPFYLDGSTPSGERVELCERFNAGEADIFLISLKAGGTGLNLTGADTVVLYDLWWNPAVEEQAIGRAHRMGQRSVVQVIRLVAEGTIEEKMLELQQHKRELIADVIDSGSGKQGGLSEGDIRELLRL
ncbi:DEAD/DEAH box helicase [Saccharibacillus sp. CPCC 101409]|uniref:DEAD/DEAH box helicase n=1 Tax=Saccharibacillus sp. CPCC 101409 TaxID=3058041 RepID=UPI002672869A|nr:DEAD/DEAH box helicase [Saccharibacillus sp. CPCC 101409]MDO3411604.1 DEAD/DEAH box helicase [Saccharibacillus sp. CPCC 101409]